MLGNEPLNRVTSRNDKGGNMAQIQKCPHCGKDAMFSHSICPNCGHESKSSERLDPDYKVDEARGGVPSYASSMEEEMTVVQHHGGILLGVVLGLLAFPLLCWSVTCLFLLLDPNRTMSIPFFRTLLVCVLLGWADWELWFGRIWVRYVLGVLGILGALSMGAYALHHVWLLVSGGEGNSLIVLACGVFAAMYGWSGWQLFRSRSIPEFMAYQRQRSESEE